MGGSGGGGLPPLKMPGDEELPGNLWMVHGAACRLTCASAADPALDMHVDHIPYIVLNITSDVIASGRYQVRTNAMIPMEGPPVPDTTLADRNSGRHARHKDGTHDLPGNHALKRDVVVGASVSVCRMKA